MQIKRRDAQYAERRRARWKRSLCTLSLPALAFALACATSLATAQTKATKAPARSQKAASAKTDPNQELLNQADTALAKEDFAAAIAALEKYTTARPEEAFGFFQLAYAHTGAKNWERARENYTKAIALDPKMGAAHLNLGLIILDQGEAKDAVAPLRRAAELLPERAQVKFVLGTALEKSGEVAPAIATYRAAITQDAKNPEYHLALGRALLNSGQHVEAQPAFEAALKLRPDAAAARLGLAQSLLAQSKWDAAAAELESYLRLVPDDAPSRQQRAHALLESGAPEKAIEELDRMEARGTPTLESQKLRAQALLQLKRIDEAAALLAKISAAEPANAEFHALLGRLYLEKRDYAAAEKSLLAALRINSQHLDAIRDLASTYYLAENYPAALRVQDALAKRETPNAFFWFVRATCFDKLGMKPQALESYEKFVAMDQGRTEKQDFQARQRIRAIKRELEKK